MTKNKKAPGEEGSRKMNGQVNSTRFLADLRAVKRPEGCIWINQDDRDMIRDLINSRIMGTTEEDSPEVRVFLPWEWDIPDQDWLFAILDFGCIRYEIVFPDWRARVRTEATQVMGDLETLRGQVGGKLAEGVAALRRAKTQQSLLTDGRMHALALLEEAQELLVQLSADGMEWAQNPEHWGNPIPESAQIEGLWYVRKED